MGNDPAATLEKKTYATFNEGTKSRGLPGLCLDLLSEQRRAWPDLNHGYDGLNKVRERTLACTGYSVRLQHNSERIKSSLAAVGEESLKRNPCFLCLDHLPEPQKGILYRREYLILCNPMPVFTLHFTVSHLRHRPQLVTAEIGHFLRLAADLGPEWAVLYNGPRCGASAPDHLHFQVVPSGRMPVETAVSEEERLDLFTPIGTSLLYRVKHLGREVVVLEGNDSEDVGGAFRRFLDVLRRHGPRAEEPMINVAGYYNPGEKGKWRLLIFPRRKHRPDAFFKTGKDRVVISPGVIDMGGVLVAPVEKDFERLDANAIEAIYQEVSLEEQWVEEAMRESRTQRPGRDSGS